MKTSCNNIEKTCKLVERLLQCVDVMGVPPIPFAGLASHRFHNPPAPHLELCLIIDGRCPDLNVGGIAHPLQAGHLSLHNVHHGNYSSHHEEMRGWCLFLSVEELPALADLGTAPFACAVVMQNPAKLAAAFRQLTDLCYEAGHPVSYFEPQPLYEQADTLNRPGLAYRVKAALLDLLGMILTEAEPAALPPTRLPEAVRQAVHNLRLHYHDTDLGLPKLARAVGLSPNHLGRLFREHMGQPPMQYLQDLRLQQARNLLHHTDLRINEIAWQVGWRDPLYFSRLFKRETGKSPSEWRQAKNH